MRFGCCGSMVAVAPDGTGIEIAESLRRIGYDYIELSLAHLAALPEAAFDALERRLERSGLRCEACNNFFPPRLRLTGSGVRLEEALDHARFAFARASRLGAEVVVFGSSGAKNVPPGFPREEAWRQIVILLQAVDGIAAESGITVAIEPLNKQESNIVNTLAEGLSLAREVNRPRIRLLVDYYHLAMEKESVDVLDEAGDLLRHVHFAEVEGRTFPRRRTEEYEIFFDKLRAVGYSGRVSVEAFSRDFAGDAARSLPILRNLGRGAERG